jgi:hypothetical protein
VLFVFQRLGSQFDESDFHLLSHARSRNVVQGQTLLLLLLLKQEASRSCCPALHLSVYGRSILIWIFALYHLICCDLLESFVSHQYSGYTTSNCKRSTTHHACRCRPTGANSLDNRSGVLFASAPPCSLSSLAMALARRHPSGRGERRERKVVPEPGNRAPCALKRPLISRDQKEENGEGEQGLEEFRTSYLSLVPCTIDATGSKFGPTALKFVSQRPRAHGQPVQNPCVIDSFHSTKTSMKVSELRTMWLSLYRSCSACCLRDTV